MPRIYKKSEKKPRKPAPSEDDMLEVMKAVKLNNEKTFPVSQRYNVSKDNSYPSIGEYDEKMRADDVTEEKLKMFVESKKKSGGQMVS